MALLQQKKIVALLFALCFLISAKGNNKNQQNSDSLSYILQNTSFNTNSSLVDSIISFSKLHLGKPYRGGGKGPNSFDCSGFTSFVFNNFGIKLGSSSSDQAEQVPHVKKEDIQPGDLVFFNGRRRGNRIGHVGMVISKHENGNFDFIHSSSSTGISITNSESDYYARRYMGAGRAVNFDTLFTRKSTHKSEQLPRITPQTDTYSQPINHTEYESTIVKKKIPAKYHTVKSGETLSEIAEKYGLTISQLKKKNHLKKDLLSLKQKLKIKDEYEVSIVEKAKPATIKFNSDSTISKEKRTATNTSTKSKTHKVKKGETLFSISKDYNIDVDALKSINNLSNGKIFVGQDIFIAGNESLNKNTEESSEISINQSTEEKLTVPEVKFGSHIVTKGETLQSISKVYMITIAELKEINNLESDNIQVGQKLNTPEKKSIKTNTSQKKKTKIHTVKSGETLSEIAEKYHCTVSQLKTWNGKKSTKLNLGEKLKIVI